MVISWGQSFSLLLHCTFTTEYYKKGRLNEQENKFAMDSDEENSDDSDNDNEEDEEEEENESEDDDLLPIEKANKKLKKLQEKQK